MSSETRWTIPEHEAGILCFVSKEKRGRYKELLNKKKGRQRLLEDLYHSNCWSEAVLEHIPAELQDCISIFGELQKHGGGNLCYCFSTNSEFDGKVVEVRRALERLVGSGDGTFLSLIPGKLGYYESEEPGQRYFLRI